MNDNLPWWVNKFVELIAPASLQEEIEGDLAQRFERDKIKYGVRKARLRLAWNAIRFLRLSIILRNKISVRIRLFMIHNYFKVMLRHMARHKINSFINIAGLTTGITFALVIGVYVWGEMQVNQQLKDVDQLYIFENTTKDGSMPVFFAPSMLGKTLVDEYPQKVENYYRFFDRMVKMSANDKNFIYQSMVGDSTLISMLGLPMIYGDAATALRDPYSVVITEDVAIQLFGRKDVVGEHVSIASGSAERKEFAITAVLPKLKSNSVTDLIHINAQVFMSFKNKEDFLLPDPDTWDGIWCLSYLKLRKDVDAKEVEAIAMKLTEERTPVQQKVEGAKLFLRPLTDYHLLSGNAAIQKMILILSGIAFFILLLASINFINISISGTAARLKEIGVRKVIGSLKKQIVFQFLAESILLTIFSGICSLVVYEVFRNYFGSIIGTTLMSVFVFSGVFWLWFVAGLILIGFVAGSYPSFLLSAYKAIDSLKGKLKATSNKSLLSRGLVTTQFTISIVVFICSIIISRQIALFLESDLGYDKSYIVTVSSTPRIWSEDGVNKMMAAKQEFLSVPQIQGATLSWGVPNGNAVSQDFNFRKPGTEREKALLVSCFSTDEDYADVFKIQVLEGGFLDKAWKPGDLVLNQSAAEALKVEVGDQVIPLFSDTAYFTVKGIVKDFHYNSLHQAVKPMGFIHTRQNLTYRFFSFRINPGNVTQALSAVERKWHEVFPDDPFDHAFMEDRLAALYKSEVQLKKASAVGTGVMTVIVIVGVLGMVSLAVTRRFKEIGIRKALGASVWNILRLFSIEYVKIIALSIAIAVPLAWLGVSRWLEGFALRVGLAWWMFALPGLVLMIVALCIVFISARKAAVSNPVDALRTE
ncbi:MAG TPA: ABC transporter permease [Cyclobacteriaceae bacterium]|nr:ABC transporter permease [Cyclobacteriaceae bacterium]